MCLKYWARTLENSLDGDMTKLSPLLDQEIKCSMVLSSSMLYNLWMKAVCTTLGPCAAPTAPAPKAMWEGSLDCWGLLPFSPDVGWSTSGLLWDGGPMDAEGEAALLWSDRGEPVCIAIDLGLEENGVSKGFRICTIVLISSVRQKTRQRSRDALRGRTHINQCAGFFYSVRSRQRRARWNKYYFRVVGISWGCY